MKFKKFLPLVMAAIIISGYAPAFDCIVLEASAASNSKLKDTNGIKSTATANSI